MKKLFIFAVLIVVLSVGFLVYKNIDKPLIDDKPSIEQPGNNNQGNIPGFDINSTPTTEGIELDKGYIYF